MPKKVIKLKNKIEHSSVLRTFLAFPLSGLNKTKHVIHIYERNPSKLNKTAHYFFSTL